MARRTIAEQQCALSIHAASRYVYPGSAEESLVRNVHVHVSPDGRAGLDYHLCGARLAKRRISRLLAPVSNLPDAFGNAKRPGERSDRFVADSRHPELAVADLLDFRVVSGFYRLRLFRSEVRLVALDVKRIYPDIISQRKETACDYGETQHFSCEHAYLQFDVNWLCS